MNIKRKRMEWEKRFPALDDTWTHWWIEGDGELIAVFKGSGQCLIKPLILSKKILHICFNLGLSSKSRF